MKGSRTMDGPIIRINRKSAFSLSKELVEALSLKEEDRIALVSENSDWYIMNKADGFKVRTQSNGTSMQFNCAELAKILLDSCKLEGQSYRMKVSQSSTTLKDGTTAWCIITASAKE